MRTGRVSDTIAAVWLAELVARTTHLTLMLADPFSVVDPLTVEPTGAFTRATVSWTVGPRLIRNTSQLVWTGIPVGSLIVAIVGMTAAFNGTVTFSAPHPPTSFPNGGGLIIPANQFFTGVDA